VPIALAGLVVVVVAVLGILLIHASQQFTRAVSGMMPDWHIPGLGSIRGWVAGATDAFNRQVLGVFAYALDPLAQLLQVPVRWLQKHLTGWLHAAAGALTVLTYLRTALIPFVLNKAIGYALTLYHAALAALVAARAELTALINYVQAHAIALISAVELRLLSAITAARAELTALINYVQAHAITLISAVESRLLSAIVAARAELTALINYVQAHAIAYTNAVAAALSTEIAGVRAWLIAYCDATVARVVNAAIANEHILLGQALAIAWPRALTEIDAVIATADKDFADALANLRSLRGLSLANPFAVVGALVGVVTALLRFTRDCTIPNCRNLSQVGRDLQELFSLVEGDIIIGLLAAAAKDPGGVGRDALAVARPVLTDAADHVRGQVAA
jgi:hypothetical protein